MPSCFVHRCCLHTLHYVAETILSLSACMMLGPLRAILICKWSSLVALRQVRFLPGSPSRKLKVKKQENKVANRNDQIASRCSRQPTNGTFLRGLALTSSHGSGKIYVRHRLSHSDTVIAEAFLHFCHCRSRYTVNKVCKCEVVGTSRLHCVAIATGVLGRLK